MANLEHTSKNESNPLESFLTNFGKFPQLIQEGMLRQSQDEDEKQLISGLGGVLQEQVSSLCEYTLKSSDFLSKQQTFEVQQVLRLTAADTLAGNAQKVAVNLSSTTAKVGAGGIFQELKKIIRMLLDAFGITLPKWLDALINLIDEILNKILSVGSLKLARSLSFMEQDYLGELSQLAKLEHERAYLYDSDDDDA